MSDPIPSAPVIITSTPIVDPAFKPKRVELEGLLNGLRMNIQRANDLIEKSTTDTKAGAELDVAQQEITRIQEVLDRP